MKLRALFFLWLCVVLSACSSVNKQKQVSSAAEGIFKRPDRIVIPATINGQPARFVFDTGADAAYLTVEAARRLGLPLTPAPSGRDGWLAGVTSPCTVTIHGVTNRRIFPVVELGGPGAKNFPLDGFLGWTCYQQAIFAIDASNLTLTAYSRVPDEVKTWQKFPLRRDARKFIFEVPLSGGGTGEVFVDTGAPDGVGLYPEKWSQWKATHPNQRLGISHAYMPYLRTGIIFREEVHADKIALGPLEITNVPVGETTQVANNQYAPSRRVATLGIAALKRLDVVVDGRHGFVYLRAKR